MPYKVAQQQQVFLLLVLLAIDDDDDDDDGVAGGDDDFLLFEGRMLRARRPPLICHRNATNVARVAVEG